MGIQINAQLHANSEYINAVDRLVKIYFTFKFVDLLKCYKKFKIWDVEWKQ